MRRPILSSLFLFLVTIIPRTAAARHPRLRPGYYSSTCPDAESIVRTTMRTAMIKEPRSAASVMRFQFHDCFVNGCDGSVLLDDTPTMLGEKLALSNINSLRDFNVVDEIKAELEEACPGIVSCADIIVMASRDAVALSGGPDWVVKLGRLDSITASQDNSSAIMPSPRSTAAALVDLFLKYGLSPRDTVALSGSHSIGEGRCFSIMYRLYNQSGSGKPDPAIDPGYLTMLDELCPQEGDEDRTGSLDSTPTEFDNQYFKDLVHGRGFLNSDQTLYSSPETRDYVVEFSRDQDEFFEAFVEGMIKLGDLVYDNPGEIRKNCRVVNARPNDMLVVS